MMCYIAICIAIYYISLYHHLIAIVIQYWLASYIVNNKQFVCRYYAHTQHAHTYNTHAHTYNTHAHYTHTHVHTTYTHTTHTHIMHTCMHSRHTHNIRIHMYTTHTYMCTLGAHIHTYMSYRSYSWLLATAT